MMKCEGDWASSPVKISISQVLFSVVLNIISAREIKVKIVILIVLAIIRISSLSIGSIVLSVYTIIYDIKICTLNIKRSDSQS